MAHRLKNQQRAERLEAGGLQRQRWIHALADLQQSRHLSGWRKASDAQERTPRLRRGGHGPVTTVTRATRPPKSIVGRSLPQPQRHSLPSRPSGGLVSLVYFC